MYQGTRSSPSAIGVKRLISAKNLLLERKLGSKMEEEEEEEEAKERLVQGY